MQRIRMKTLSATPERSLQPDQVAVLPDDEALELIVKGFAVPVDRHGHDVLIPAEELTALRTELLNGLSVFLDDNEEEELGDGAAGDEDGSGDGGDQQAGAGADGETTAQQTPAPADAADEPAAVVEDEAEAKARRARRSRRT